MTKTFVLGVGCEKGATSWLAHHIGSTEACAPPFTKELHVFDSYFSPDIHPFQKLRTRELLAKTRRGIADLCLAKHVDMGANLQSYVEYFRRKTSDPRIQLTYDITPSYAGLNEDQLRVVRELLERAGFRVVVVFIMREPVSRIYSAARMWDSRAALAREPRVPVEERIRQGYRNPQVVLRTRYEHTVRNLDSVFESNQLYYGFYEELFEEEKLNALDRLLGVTLKHENVDKIVHSHPEENRIDGALAEEVRSYYSDTYRYCSERFGRSVVEELWGRQLVVSGLVGTLSLGDAGERGTMEGSNN